MGHRMEIYVSPEVAQDIIGISEGLGVEARIVGRVEAADAKQVGGVGIEVKG
jgi:phosphoribosylformylglycinamidine cyclo-ligase